MIRIRAGVVLVLVLGVPGAAAAQDAPATSRFEIHGRVMVTLDSSPLQDPPPPSAGATRSDTCATLPRRTC